MPVVVGTGDRGNRIEISMPNGLTQDLSSDRSVMHSDINITDESVHLQVSKLSRHRLRCWGVRSLGVELAWAGASEHWQGGRGIPETGRLRDADVRSVLFVPLIRVYVLP